MEVDEESEEEWDGDALGEEECLFCSKISDSLEANVKHMTHKHSFFIPDIEYLDDLNGLITYLGRLIDGIDDWNILVGLMRTKCITLIIVALEEHPSVMLTYYNKNL